MNSRKHSRATALRFGFAALAGAALLAVAGCTNAQLTDVYQDPDFRGPGLRSVLVVSQRKDDVQRRLWEDEVTGALRQQGVLAISSYTVYPNGMPSQNDLSAAVAEQHLDGAVIIRPLKASAETHWMPGWTSIRPVDAYNPWSGRDVIVYRDRYHPGYHYIDRVVRQQVTVWTSGKDGRMIWAGTVEVENPGNADQFRHDLASSVAPQLRKFGVLA
ncbi:MAG TPA: hypothetical protein VMJ70_00465 [Candidatus Sulfotelmatobacter sp.]|nr:hypothetical protein [Candidatus Sulfotelmatobacter sp.]